MFSLLSLGVLLLGGEMVVSAVSSDPPDSDRLLSSMSETDGYWGSFRDRQTFHSADARDRGKRSVSARRGERCKTMDQRIPGYRYMTLCRPPSSPMPLCLCLVGLDATKDPCLMLKYRSLHFSFTDQASGSERVGHFWYADTDLSASLSLSGKVISVKCDGPCPCLPGQEAIKPKHRTTQAVCSDRDLHSLGSRLNVWFRVLYLDANRDLKASDSSDSAPGRLDTSILPICKDSLGWIFNKLDVNFDLLLDQSAKHPLPGQECPARTRRAGFSCWVWKSLMGTYTPRCTEEGYFKSTQCHGSTGQCWCVDKYGNEIAGSRKQGNPSCGELCSLMFLVAIEDDEDEGEEKDDEMGYIW
ncbi:hypothetical protein NHX12_012116 [Muraenolepis orangiensis]|uniref:Thyroglobulin type-1 domain-containing protein n=1 Tax=Muraenolepis orangiensis TaxID=630683 RepID=A0A9Q0DHJ4_9TELE|nr:hypothetical protein NHX12_012116 [Muraenolepis orangiensis]